jgi:hypothetical protein
MSGAGIRLPDGAITDQGSSRDEGLRLKIEVMGGATAIESCGLHSRDRSLSRLASRAPYGAKAAQRLRTLCPLR